MNKKYIIGIDAGSQSSKVVIFDLKGEIICEGTQALKAMNLPEPGIVEHPDDDLWTSIVKACQEAMAKFPGDKNDLIGVGLCTIRFCRCLLKKDGKLATPAMSWMDDRVSKPHVHDNKDVAYITTSSGYISHRFTGQTRDTAANYQGVWPMDTDTWQWSENPEAYELTGMPREMLFDLQMPGTILGHVTNAAAEATGIPSGLPVVATANDKAVEALGAGLKGKSSAVISLGTYIAAMIQGVDNPKDSKGFWTNFACLPNQYLYESHGIRRGMWTISWFKSLLGEEFIQKAASLNMSPEELLNKEAESVPMGCDGLMTVLDWLAPTTEPYKKGVMIGFDGRHTRGHMYRSILEAIALTMKNNLDVMCQELGIELENIILSGGGSSSDLFMQIFADVFGLPVSRNGVNGAAAVGSAICVAVATKVYPDFETAIQNMVNVRDVFNPVQDHTAFYSKVNKEVYKGITHHTDQVLKSSYPIFS